MNLDHIIYFIELCKFKSYTETAINLNRSQSTLSYAITKLEKELGFSLIRRSTKDFRLTKYGHIFLEIAYEIKRIIEFSKNINLNSKKGLNFIKYHKNLENYNLLRENFNNMIKKCNHDSPYEAPFYMSLCLEFPELIVNFDDGFKEVDLYDPLSNIYIELDGGQHLQENQRAKDDIRDSFSIENGVYTLRWSRKNLRDNWDYCTYRTKQILKRKRNEKRKIFS